MTATKRIAIAVALLLAGMGIWVRQNPETVSNAVATVSSWVGLSSKIDAAVIVEETSVRPTLTPSVRSVLQSSTLKASLSKHNVKLVGPLDKDITGKLPPGVAKAIEIAKTKKLPRLIGLCGTTIVFDVELPATEAAVIERCGGNP